MGKKQLEGIFLGLFTVAGVWALCMCLFIFLHKNSTKTSHHECAVPAILPTEPNAIEKLRADAHRLHIKWLITCDEFYDGPGIKFFGWAVPDSSTWKLTWERGAKPGWIVFGFSQESVAKKLDKLIFMEPNSYPNHECEETPEKQKMYPLQLEVE